MTDWKLVVIFEREEGEYRTDLAVFISKAVVPIRGAKLTERSKAKQPPKSMRFIISQALVPTP